MLTRNEKYLQLKASDIPKKSIFLHGEKLTKRLTVFPQEDPQSALLSVSPACALCA
jgi:hypothetical protein